MERVTNSAGKTICMVDLASRCIEIQFKGLKSMIWFDPDGVFHQWHQRRNK